MERYAQEVQTRKTLFDEFAELEQRCLLLRQNDMLSGHEIDDLRKLQNDLVEQIDLTVRLACGMEIANTAQQLEGAVDQDPQREHALADVAENMRVQAPNEHMAQHEEKGANVQAFQPGAAGNKHGKGAHNAQNEKALSPGKPVPVSRPAVVHAQLGLEGHQIALPSLSPESFVSKCEAMLKHCNGKSIKQMEFVKMFETCYREKLCLEKLGVDWLVQALAWSPLVRCGQAGISLSTVSLNMRYILFVHLL